TLDLSQVAAGTQATLIFRLVNDDGDTGTSVHLTCVDLPTGGTIATTAVGSTKGDLADSADGVISPDDPSGRTGVSFASDATAAHPLGAAASQAVSAGAGVVGAQADSPKIEVAVGYADNLRPSPFFPNPWAGSPNVVFVGENSPNNEDSGAIRIVN